MKKIILSCLCLFISMPALAMTTGAYYKISKLYSWADYVNGAILIQLENQNTLCPNGYWLEASKDSSSTNILSVALSAYHAQTPILIHADENADWVGLSTKECEIKLIILE